MGVRVGDVDLLFFEKRLLLFLPRLASSSLTIVSLRKIEEDTINNLAYKWLTGDMTIDHSTMGLFLARFVEEIVELFSQVVASCTEQNLIEFDLLAIDTVKLRASANHKQSKTLEGIKKEENKIAERLKEVLETASDAKSAETEEVLALKRRAQRVQEARKILLQNRLHHHRPKVYVRRNVYIVRGTQVSPAILGVCRARWLRRTR